MRHQRQRRTEATPSPAPINLPRHSAPPAIGEEAITSQVTASTPSPPLFLPVPTVSSAAAKSKEAKAAESLIPPSFLDFLSQGQGRAANGTAEDANKAVAPKPQKTKATGAWKEPICSTSISEGDSWTAPTTPSWDGVETMAVPASESDSSGTHGGHHSSSADGKGRWGVDHALAAASMARIRRGRDLKAAGDFPGAETCFVAALVAVPSLTLPPSLSMMLLLMTAS